VTEAVAVLDASAMVAFLRKEKGAEKVRDVLTACCISAVNLSETYYKMVEKGEVELEQVIYQVGRLDIPLVVFDEEQAKISASLWKPTRKMGLSLGDRCCLALALKLGLPVYTTDHRWEKCPVGVDVVLIRPPQKLAAGDD
jgi:ribonuclease VapC